LSVLSEREHAVKAGDANLYGPDGEGSLYEKRCDRYGEVMQIAFYTQSDLLFQRIEQAFEEDGNYTCVRFVSELSLIRFLERHAPALVLFDAGRTSPSGPAVLSWRSCHFHHYPPVMVIGQSWECDSVIEALDGDADEIVVGTPSARELLVRAHRTIAKHRGTAKTATRISLGDYTIERTDRTVSFRGRCVRLTARELNLAWLLFTTSGSLLTRESISNSVWGKDTGRASGLLAQYIYRLRCKLALDEDSDLQLKTIYSLGYVFEHRSTPHAMQTVPCDRFASETAHLGAAQNCDTSTAGSVAAEKIS
jgi:DNA-binding response OmpR family regulator